MPRIRKPKHRIPSEVLHLIARYEDVILQVEELDGFKLGDRARYYYEVGTVVGFVQEGCGQERQWCLLEMQLTGGRYDNGYYVYEPSDLTKLS